MKKLSIVFILLFELGLFAKSSTLAPLPLPQNIFISLDIDHCGVACMEDFIKNEKFFSFMANYSDDIESDTIKNRYQNLSILFKSNATSSPIEIAEDITPTKEESGQVKLAILVPQKRIRRYSTTVINSIISYLLSRNSGFDIEVFNTQDESTLSLGLAFENIRKRGFSVVVAPVTPVGARYITSNVSDLLVFIPTIHSSSMQDARENIVFGGINYAEQIQKVSRYANQRVATFSDGSSLGIQLDEIVGQNVYVDYHNEIVNSKVSLKSMLKGNNALNGASIFLNMPIVKSSLLASQLRVYDITPNALLSTQINYHPMLLTLTQYDDRKSLYIANSIQPSPLQIRATNSLFDHTIVYDWVNYSANIGMDYLFCQFFAKNNQRAFTEPIESGQILYNTNIIKSSRYGFYSVSD